MRVDKTFAVYVEMRTSGRTAISALDALRARIETMPPAECKEIVRLVKNWEDERRNARRAKAAALRTTQIVEAIALVPEPDHSTEPIVPVVDPVIHSLSGVKRPLCPRCAKPNKVGEVFCAHCGRVPQDRHQPQPNVGARPYQLSSPAPTISGQISTLVLIVAKDKNQLPRSAAAPRSRNRPSGAADGGTVKPDIDLSAHDAAIMGVSRLHVALNYKRHR